jgi:hypothetical protein
MMEKKQSVKNHVKAEESPKASLRDDIPLQSGHAVR